MSRWRGTMSQYEREECPVLSSRHRTGARQDRAKGVCAQASVDAYRKLATPYVEYEANLRIMIGGVEG